MPDVRLGLKDIVHGLGAANAFRWSVPPMVFGLISVVVYAVAMKIASEGYPLHVECIGVFALAFALFVVVRLTKVLLTRRNMGEAWRDPNTLR